VITEAIGVFCTTADSTDPLMWVHYAAQHSGFLIGFKANASLFSDEEGELAKVEYEAAPADIVPPDKRLCWYKDAHWSYEKEWRCVRAIKKGGSRDIALDPSDIAEIVLGARMNPGHITAILEFAHYMKPEYQIPIRVAKLDTATHGIVSEPSRLEYCTNCNGNGHFRPKVNAK
jgi:hypothetical protein